LSEKNFLQGILNTAEVSNFYFKKILNNYSIGLEYFVDPDFDQSNIELGTREHPFSSIDDAFRELFNR
jgi:hypothetical protein